jgi:glucose-6-phosphate 1-dehydrogenase
MEKPFGTDLASAVSLSANLHEIFAENQIFRIDHFLGKEPAQNILAFRFGNGLFEPICNRNFIDHVQIDVPETLGLDGRAGFYEGTGAFRDMVVTHLFQILAFMAMEPASANRQQQVRDPQVGPVLASSSSDDALIGNRTRRDPPNGAKVRVVGREIL